MLDLLIVYKIVLVLLVVFFVLLRVKTCLVNYITVYKLPGPPRSNWIIGNLSTLHTPPDEIFKTLRKCANKFYPIYKFFAFYKVVANVITPEDCELIMSNSAHNAKGLPYELLDGWLKKGLLTSAGDKWQLRRKILTPAFHFNILQEFIKVFNEEAEQLVEVLKEESKNYYTNVSPIITQFTLKTITETAMGTKVDLTTQKHREYKQAVYDIGKILLYRLFHPWLILNWVNTFRPHYYEERRITKTLHQFTKQVIQEREKNFSEIELPVEEHDVYKGKQRLAMLDLLLSAKRKTGLIDNKGIQEEVDTFMFEGHDTTSMALGFALFLLANHREAQDLCVKEMEEVLGDIRKKPTYNELQSLKYMERCIKETLRLYPSVFFIMRTLGADLVTHSGHLLPKDTIVVIHIYDVHHDAKIYPDPEKFDPDRFLPENVQKRHPYAYLPFSAGPRNCIGQKFAILELKAALCAVLGNFIIDPIDTVNTLVLVADIVLRPKEGIKVKFTPRVKV